VFSQLFRRMFCLPNSVFNHLVCLPFFFLRPFLDTRARFFVMPRCTITAFHFVMSTSETVTTAVCGMPHSLALACMRIFVPRCLFSLSCDVLAFSFRYCVFFPLRAGRSRPVFPLSFFSQNFIPSSAQSRGSHYLSLQVTSTSPPWPVFFCIPVEILPPFCGLPIFLHRFESTSGPRPSPSTFFRAGFLLFSSDGEISSKRIFLPSILFFFCWCCAGSILRSVFHLGFSVVLVFPRSVSAPQATFSSYPILCYLTPVGPEILLVFSPRALFVSPVFNLCVGFFFFFSHSY